jgi:uncharacterized lipoprotein YmbA
MYSKWLIALLFSGLLAACGSGEQDDALYQSQKQAIDKAKDVERLMKEQADATREKLDKL